jgi:lysozyme
VSNTCPPRALWQNCIQPLVVLDEIRERLREPVRITSAYRSPAYNRAVGGELMSYHLQFMALDFTCRRGAAVSAAVARELRGTRFKLPGGGSFVWRGGIGQYPGFVHIDTRGKDANW